MCKSHTHTHTNVHACMHACTHKFTHTYIHIHTSSLFITLDYHLMLHGGAAGAKQNTHTHVGVHACMHACMHTPIHTYVHTDTHLLALQIPRLSPGAPTGVAPVLSPSCRERVRHGVKVFRVRMPWQGGEAQNKNF